VVAEDVFVHLKLDIATVVEVGEVDLDLCQLGRASALLLLAWSVVRGHSASGRERGNHSSPLTSATEELGEDVPWVVERVAAAAIGGLLEAILAVAIVDLALLQWRR
jgi:hypothetical protein